MSAQQHGVTVYCLTFNHAPYIGQTLQGFLDQEVDFPVHIIVHDDASTDGTQDVIKEYVSKNPELFTVILQSENQYSKRTDIYKTYIVSEIKTEYVCICEGDDYWSDPNKLKLQYEYMQAHPECSMCVHNTDRVNADGVCLQNPFSTLTEDRDYDADQVIASGGGVLFHTSSFMYRHKYRQAMPDCYYISHVGDYPLAMHMSTCGHIHYIGRIMSMYRVDTPGSWTQRVVADPEKHIRHLNNVIEMLQRADDTTMRRYHAAFQEAINKNIYDRHITKNQIIPILRSNDFRRLFSSEPKARQVKLILRGMAGPLLQPIKKLKYAVESRK